MKKVKKMTEYKQSIVIVRQVGTFKVWNAEKGIGALAALAKSEESGDM